MARLSVSAALSFCVFAVCAASVAAADSARPKQQTSGVGSYITGLLTTVSRPLTCVKQCQHPDLPFTGRFVGFGTRMCDNVERQLVGGCENHARECARARLAKGSCTPTGFGRIARVVVGESSSASSRDDDAMPMPSAGPVDVSRIFAADQDYDSVSRQGMDMGCRVIRMSCYTQTCYC